MNAVEEAVFVFDTLTGMSGDEFWRAGGMVAPEQTVEAFCEHLFDIGSPPPAGAEEALAECEVEIGRELPGDEIERLLLVGFLVRLVGEQGSSSWAAGVVPLLGAFGVREASR